MALPEVYDLKRKFKKKFFLLTVLFLFILNFQRMHQAPPLSEHIVHFLISLQRAPLLKNIYF